MDGPALPISTELWPSLRCCSESSGCSLRPALVSPVSFTGSPSPCWSEEWEEPWQLNKEPQALGDEVARRGMPSPSALASGSQCWGGDTTWAQICVAGPGLPQTHPLLFPVGSRGAGMNGRQQWGRTATRSRYPWRRTPCTAPGPKVGWERETLALRVCVYVCACVLEVQLVLAEGAGSAGTGDWTCLFNSIEPTG